jgi:hypothetical protein
MTFRDQPIQQKLIRLILVTCSVALVLMSGAYILFEYYSTREAEKNKVATLALVIASNSSGALAFNSPEDATETLNALGADSYVTAACLYDNNGKLFAKYPKNLAPKLLPALPGTKGYSFNGGFIEGFETVHQQGLKLGTLYLKSSLEGLNKQIRFNIAVALFLIGLTLVAGYFLTIIFQKTISDPIISLERTAKSISENQNYSIRAIKSGNDELGSLTDAFNHMLSQIETQNTLILKANQESSKLAAIVESSGDAIIGSTINKVINSWNKSAAHMLGYSDTEMIGQPVSVIFASKEDASVVFQRMETEQHILPFETQFINKDGKILDISLTVSPLRDSDGKVIGSSQIARDITEHKKKEQQIIQNEEHLRLATQSAELGTFDLDLLAGTMMWDPRCRELFGIYHDNPVTYEGDFLTGLHDDDRPRITQTIENAFNKNLSNGNYDVEYRTIGETDKKLRWVKAKGKVFFGQNDVPVRFIGSVLDITRQKHDEQRKNDFIAIISHELKTPLTTIKSYLQILLRNAKKDSDSFIINALTRAESQANKMSSMLKDFLNLARLEAGEFKLDKEIINLNSLLSELVSEAELLSSSHPIKSDFCEDPKILADKDKIGQIIINLISNAGKYSPVGSTITVGCERHENRIRIFVKDEGVGISLKDQKKLFNRFYRVKDEKTKTVSGFGIGLFIVSEILKYHGSQIEVQSEVGVGSTFYFHFDEVIVS